MRSKSAEVADERFLVVGLGNPGSEYDQTRHNAGFDTLDIIAQEMHAKYWKNECGALVTCVDYQDKVLILAKPQSFMNVSGGPVKKLCESYKIEPSRLIVIHDELDIEPGSIRVKFGGGHAGHNGLKSITEKLGSKDWYRVRIGIGRPPGRMSVSDYVLSRPKKEAAEEFALACQTGATACLHLISQGLEKTQQSYN